MDRYAAPFENLVRIVPLEVSRIAAVLGARRAPTKRGQPSKGEQRQDIKRDPWWVCYDGEFRR